MRTSAPAQGHATPRSSVVTPVRSVCRPLGPVQHPYPAAISARRPAGRHSSGRRRRRRGGPAGEEPGPGEAPDGTNSSEGTHTQGRTGKAGVTCWTVKGRPVLTPDSRLLRSLLTRYADLRIAEARGEKREGQRLEDVCYTLCVMTGTNRVEDALAAADSLLAAARVTKVRPQPSAADLPVTELAA
ncbi:DUF5133 domain-containing protein [Streptomyces sp. NPDC013012]|uniref:DUF5133 domain-containing protein n=1 Tax=Streptomyces sp. NPDC013012 TaxID=3364860 RepID=UPI00368F34ED